MGSAKDPMRSVKGPLGSVQGSLRSDTRQLLRTGGTIFATGVIAALLTVTVFGGIGRQGPHTNSGWLALMVAMGCLPTGALTLALGVAKLFGDRRR